MPLLKTIAYILSNELEKTLFCLLDDNSNVYLDEKSYYKFLEMLLGQNPRYSKTLALESLMRLILKQPDWQGSLRHLMVFHKLTHDLGENCFQWISSEKIQHLYNYNPQGLTVKMFVHKAMVSYYHNYLKKLSHNYEDLSICFHFDNQYQAKLAQEKISPLQSTSKLQNVLRYLIQIFSLFDASILDFKSCLLVKQVTYFCFTDCYHYYTHINKIVTSLLKQFFSLSKDDALLLYEIYSEHIIITRKLKPLFALGDQLSEFVFKTPEFFVLDNQYNTIVELYVATLKGGKLIRTNTPEFSLQDTSIVKESNDSNALSTKEVSRIIAEVTSSINQSSTYKKNLFEPPKGSQKNKLAGALPKLRVVKTNTIVPWAEPEQTPKPRPNVDLQKTRGSFSSNLKPDASPRFEGGAVGNNFLHQSIDQPSSYPLAHNESFMKDDNVGSSSARTEYVQNAY